MHGENTPRTAPEPAIVELGAITERTLGDLMPNAWESPVLKDLYDPQ